MSSSTPMTAPSTADICDAAPGSVSVCMAALFQYGGHRSFTGEVATVQCHEDNVVMRQVLSEPGNGRVLVVDGRGSLRVALMGDNIAELAAGNGWTGVIINGAVRDAERLRDISLGIKAAGTNPRASGKAGIGQRDVDVTFGGVSFRPGQTIYADDDGLVVVE